MEFNRSDANVFVPDGIAMPEALERTTHLCIGAHPDDQEFMAYHGIVECFQQKDKWFGGVVVTNGSGSARSGPYTTYSDEDMMRVRRVEQYKAATVGEYSCQIQLAYSSADVKDPGCTAVFEDLVQIVEVAKPDIVYLHNPTDKHDTHVAVMLRSLAALRALAKDHCPSLVIGCEGWRSLDWVNDDEKLVLDVDRHRNLLASVTGVFDSQISGGKRYDTANMGRQSGNATFFQSHETDESAALSWGIDLTPLVLNADLAVTEYAAAFIDRFKQDVADRIGKLA